MACALAGGMHYVPFTFKRAHYASLKMMMPIAAWRGLTPARFDLLYYASKLGVERYQANIARSLGVSRATVCKMVQAMTKAGLVTCDDESWDRRRRRVNPTPLGKRCFTRVAKRIRLYRTVERKLRRSLETRFCTYALNDALLELDRVAGIAGRVPRGLRDGAAYFYPTPTAHFDNR